MLIECVGGGPAGLFFAILTKLLNPAHQITVLERDLSGRANGWGIVYGDDLLETVGQYDTSTARAIKAESMQWVGQEIRIGPRSVVHLGNGHGYSLDRRRLLEILRDRATELGVNIEPRQVVDELDLSPEASLIVLADGVRSSIREKRADRFGTQKHFGTTKYIWLGTHHKLDTFTFAFEMTEHGWIWFHGYRFSPSTSTVIAECPETVWTRSGFAALDDAEVRTILSKIFSHHLDGHELMANPGADSPGHWTNFTAVRNERWHDGRLALLGDAAHTTHFSIGSGTRLALQDAMALSEAVAPISSGASAARVQSALSRYAEVRQPTVENWQRDAARSASWFENAETHLKQKPLDVAYSLGMRREPARSGVSSAWRYRAHQAMQYRPVRWARRLTIPAAWHLRS